MLDDEYTLRLPDRPADQAGRPAAAWEEPLTLRTYEPLPPDRFPAYLDRRVYQGSSGRVYPLPFHHRIATEPHLRRWRAVHLQNEWLHVVVLPELGGRVHVVRDRASGRDLFYTNPVIKPALVGLAGPWVAGGVELNWPQHHRPGTYLPVDAEIEHEPDGAVVVRCSDHDPFARMKGMHALRLRPGSALLELAVRLYNRSEVPQTFLWWANVAARVDDDYQSFFPRDVRFVADHARRAVTAFPRADRPYYGVDYPARAGERNVASDGTVHTGDRIDWYRNIPVPTSYMCLESDEGFFGGYDHGAGLGFVHVADQAISPGKKQWTWGSSPFGHAWDANLADDGAHYVELMAGVFTDNQPDFAHLAPGETKVFSQYWYPIRGTGPVDRATVDGAVRLERRGDTAVVAVAVPRALADVEVTVTADGRTVAAVVVDLDPGRPYRGAHVLPPGAGPATVAVTRAGRELVVWSESAAGGGTAREPEPATEPPEPAAVDSVEELALVAAHLELYRHATRSPEPYWHEALRRDPDHVDSLTGLAVRAYGAGRYAEARDLAERAAGRLTRRHRSPRDTRPLYVLGLALEALGDDDRAYRAHAQASWARAWRAPAGYRMARIDARAGRHPRALERLADVLRTEPEHLQALALAVVCHRRLGHADRAADLLARARALDPMDAWLRFLDGLPPSGDAQTCLDVAIELSGAGEAAAALDCLAHADDRESRRASGQTAAGPLVAYHRAHVLGLLGRPDDAAAERARARRLDATWCFPGRLADAAVLTEAVATDPGDARARALLGHWCYAVGRHGDAADLWRAAAALDPGDAVVWRNLGLVAADRERDLEAARGAYDRARAAAPDDARLLYERDQLDALAGVAPAQRLAALLRRRDLALERDDLAVELLHLLVTAGREGEALEILGRHRFHPWEGGEGQVVEAWERAHARVAVAALAGGRPAAAATALRAALDPPASLGEARHPLASTARLHLLLGDALDRAGDEEGAAAAWAVAAAQRGDFLAMSAQPHSEATFWTVLALGRAGRDAEAWQLTASLRGFRDELAAAVPRVDYFATSLPDLLLFQEDPVRVRDRRLAVLDAQLAVLEGDGARAVRVLRRPALAPSRVAADLRHAVEHLRDALSPAPTRQEDPA
ncbi:DUF5107 domain-containing protein [Puerhibacterium puerhi]|uniref:DUF5107 domain-containing protein n=1 Tax=Puerhibacterium puerhi TaxID=2692623 RepID=UPI00135CDBE2|nr:DUF5107 domain-containing protein [Puerhibacterium puerhi]